MGCGCHGSELCLGIPGARPRPPAPAFARPGNQAPSGLFRALRRSAARSISSCAGGGPARAAWEPPSYACFGAPGRQWLMVSSGGGGKVRGEGGRGGSMGSVRSCRVRAAGHERQWQSAYKNGRGTLGKRCE
eukprot:scaffold3430_cov114-Isochrysis_galbana.AAC.3